MGIPVRRVAVIVAVGVLTVVAGALAAAEVSNVSPRLARAAAPKPPVNVHDVVAAAVKRLKRPAPSIMTSPATLDVSPLTPGWVGQDIWFWDAASWGPVTTTASLRDVSVTVTAKVDHAVWSGGDGTTFRCDGPGTPRRVPTNTDGRWLPGEGQVSASPDCGHTYQASSYGVGAQHAYPVTAVTHWSAVWSASTGETGKIELTPLRSTALLRIADWPALRAWYREDVIAGDWPYPEPL